MIAIEKVTHDNIPGISLTLGRMELVNNAGYLPYHAHPDYAP
ncbi:Hypothetical protein ETEE_3659 [Edwardsiella anguillarum ET080813]|uniref:Uncharacterized protein n=1 Tax=Edwardsiella anguillarum ET080813 TaxID=667120 RepID=A0A076LXC6_9GAMM|nr:Hypothetical protein ETEE_3659 [Edwardsiella anguillarum ET080813]